MLASRELRGPESGFEQSVGKGHALGVLQDENRKREDLVFWGVRRGVMEGTGVLSILMMKRDRIHIESEQNPLRGMETIGSFIMVGSWVFLLTKAFLFRKETERA